RGEAKPLLHVLRNFQSPERLDLPLRRTVPYRVGAPEYVFVAETLDQRTQHRCTEARIGDGRDCERCAEIAVDVADTELLRDPGQITDPVDLSGVLELVEFALRVFEEGAKRRVVDHKIHLRPLLRRLTDVVHIGVAPGTARYRGLVILRH